MGLSARGTPQFKAAKTHRMVLQLMRYASRGEKVLVMSPDAKSQAHIQDTFHRVTGHSHREYPHITWSVPT